ncbi:hypothetical protein HK101_005115, partial [Irineochytrium annulatum]
MIISDPGTLPPIHLVILHAAVAVSTSSTAPLEVIEDAVDPNDREMTESAIAAHHKRALAHAEAAEAAARTSEAILRNAGIFEEDDAAEAMDDIVGAAVPEEAIVAATEIVISTLQNMKKRVREQQEQQQQNGHRMQTQSPAHHVKEEGDAPFAKRLKHDDPMSFSSAPGQPSNSPAPFMQMPPFSEALKTDSKMDLGLVVSRPDSYPRPASAGRRLEIRHVLNDPGVGPPFRANASSSTGSQHNGQNPQGIPSQPFSHLSSSSSFPAALQPVARFPSPHPPYPANPLHTHQFQPQPQQPRQQEQDDPSHPRSSASASFFQPFGPSNTLPPLPTFRRVGKRVGREYARPHQFQQNAHPYAPTATLPPGYQGQHFTSHDSASQPDAAAAESPHPAMPDLQHAAHPQITPDPVNTKPAPSRRKTKSATAPADPSDPTSKPKPPPQRRKKWDASELLALEEGMRVHGTHWAGLLADPRFAGRLQGRGQMQLKDKAATEKERR